MQRHQLSQWFHNELGLFTFPVVLIDLPNGKKTKKPTIKKWRELPLPDKAPSYHNYGVRLDQRLVVVDVDVKDGKRGQDTWNKMRAMLPAKKRREIDNLGERLICSTMTGGRHHFFKLPEGAAVQKNPPGFPDIDFLSEGSFIVGAGTDFGTGTTYTILAGAIDWEYIPDYPDEWLAATMKRETERRVEERDFSNTPSAIQQFTNYCQNCPPAVEGCRGDETTLKVALTARDLGLDGDVCFRVMWEHYNPRCQPAWDEGGLELKIRNAYEYGKGSIGAEDYSHLLVALESQAKADLDESIADEGYRWKMNSKGFITDDSEENTICYLKARNRGEFTNELWGIFRYNAFSQTVEYVMTPPWYNAEEALENDTHVPTHISEAELGHIKHYLYQKYGYSAERNTIGRAVDFVARQQGYHPIRSWLKSLQWDGIPRLESWLSVYCGAEYNDYTRAIAPKVLLGAVSRIMNPGCKMDYTLILEGEQGTGKSTVCDILGMRKEWYARMRPDIDRDARMVLSRKWIIEYAEIDALGKKEANQVKNFMDNQVDTYRVPYGRGIEDFPRQSIFIGTVNPNANYDYLNDNSGGRRFWPVKTDFIDSVRLRRDADQLYAEAMALYYAGEKPFLPRQFDDMLAGEVSKRQHIDPIVEDIRTYLEANEGIMSVNIKSLGVNQCHIPVERFDIYARRRVLEALKILGWGAVRPGDPNAVPSEKYKYVDRMRVRESIQDFRETLVNSRTMTYARLIANLELGVADRGTKRMLAEILKSMPDIAIRSAGRKHQTVITIPPLKDFEV